MSNEYQSSRDWGQSLVNPTEDYCARLPAAQKRGEIRAQPLSDYPPEDQAFYRFWYGHMKNDLMQPRLATIDHATARYIWDAARTEPDLERLGQMDVLLTDYRNGLLSGNGVIALKAYSALIDYLQNKAYCLGRSDEREKPNGAQVDWRGLALELEAQAKVTESKTAMRAMYSAARGLRLMGGEK